MNKKERFSPKTYIENVLYDKVELKRGRKRKTVSQEKFTILGFAEFENLLQINYNVAQLKQMCRHYKQKVSGNKPQLINRMYNFLKFSNYAAIAQKHIRGWLRRKYFKLNGIQYRTKCVNETDFFTLMNITDIPYHQFYCYKDGEGFIYGFNIKSLYNLMMKSEGNLKNPYTRAELPKNIIKQIRRFIKLSHILKEPITIRLKDDSDTLSHKKRISLKTLSIFHRIDTFGHITDTSWFLSLERTQLVRFVRELQDIWEYRANLTEQVTFRDIVLDELSKSEFGKNLLIESNLQQLDEMQIFNRLVAKVKGVAGTIKNTVKNIYNAIMKRVTQAFNYIKSLGIKLIEGLMNFLGVEVSDIKVRGSGDFALL